MAHKSASSSPSDLQPLSFLAHGPLYSDGFFWLTLGLTLFALAPFLQPGYHWGANDARHHVYFLFEFDRLVQDGIWWPRWSPDFAFGYGYPFFNIYAPLSHLIAEVLHVFARLDYVGAIEAVFGLSIVASAGAMYICVRDWIPGEAGRRGGLISALVYTYAPYHLLNLYVRANLAESMALLWLPLCLWAFRPTVHTHPEGGRSIWPWVLVGGICYAGLMLTSNLVIVLFTPFLAAYILFWMAQGWLAEGWLESGRSVAGRLMAILRLGVGPLLAALMGLGLSAIFWLPMVLERQYVRVDQWFGGRYDFRDDFLYFFQLFSPHWDFGVSLAGPGDSMGFGLGVAPVALALLGAILAWQRVRQARGEIAFLALAGLAALFVTLNQAQFLWQLPGLGTVLQFAQFPWRWLPLAVLCMSLLAGLLPALEAQSGQKGVSLSLFFLVALIILGSYPLLRVEIRPPAEGPVGLAALMRFERDADEMTGSTAWVKQIPTWSPMAEYYINLDQAGQPVTPVTSKVDYANVDYQTLILGSVAHNTVMEKVYFCTDYDPEAKKCNPRDDQRILFNHFYYPGWTAYFLADEQGEPTQTLPILIEEEGTLGRMTVPIPPAGEGYILLRYEETWPRIAGKWISWISSGFLLFVGLILLSQRLLHRRR